MSRIILYNVSGKYRLCGNDDSGRVYLQFKQEYNGGKMGVCKLCGRGIVDGWIDIGDLSEYCDWHMDYVPF